MTFFSNLGRVSLRKIRKVRSGRIVRAHIQRNEGRAGYRRAHPDGELFMTLIYDAACFDHETGKKIWAKVRDAVRAIT